MILTATHTGDEVQVEFTARGERVDYGVTNSPVWDELLPETIEVYTLSIMGVDVELEELPKPLQKAIMDIADSCEFQSED